MNSVIEFQKMKNDGEKISVVTCYDYWSACILNNTDVDAVLVGDSTAMVMHGFSTTTNADMDMMAMHVSAVSKGLSKKILIADMPFLAHRKELTYTMESVEKLIKAGGQAVKIEGAKGSTDTIQHVVESGVPVMGHLGMTPQSVHQFGGFKVQGKEDKAAQNIIDDAKRLEDVGCFAMVLELVPSNLAKKITDSVSIPTIGIGAGPQTSGQVLVLQDLLGMNDDFKPKFLRTYLDGAKLIKDAINNYNKDVKTISFPTNDESF